MDGLTHKIICIQTAPYLWSPGVEEVYRRIHSGSLLLFLEVGDYSFVSYFIAQLLSLMLVRQNTNALCAELI